LQIHGRHSASIANQFGGGNGEQTHSATEIQHGHAFPQEWLEDSLWPVYESPQSVIQEITTPPGTYMLAHPQHLP
jgi:hypothetical protein